MANESLVQMLLRRQRFQNNLGNIDQDTMLADPTYTQTSPTAMLPVEQQNAQQPLNPIQMMLMKLGLIKMPQPQQPSTMVGSPRG